MTLPVANLADIRDQAAYGLLSSCLGDALRELRALAMEPVVVASCPSKFNDAWNDKDWRAIRVGPFFSQRTEYFANPEDHDSQLRDGPENARAASRVLDHLEAGHWRDLYERTFERRNMSYEEVIALVLQEGRAWLVVNGSNSGESAVYSVTADGGLCHVGRCHDRAERFDQGLTAERPLVIRLVEEDAADLAAVGHRIAALERGDRHATPDWYLNIRQLWGHSVAMGRPDTQQLMQRLTALAETGRVSKEDYQLLESAIFRCLG